MTSRTKSLIHACTRQYVTRSSIQPTDNHSGHAELTNTATTTFRSMMDAMSKYEMKKKATSVSVLQSLSPSAVSTQLLNMLRPTFEAHESPESTWNMVKSDVRKSRKYTGCLSRKKYVPKIAYTAAMMRSNRNALQTGKMAEETALINFCKLLNWLKRRTTRPRRIIRNSFAFGIGDTDPASISKKKITFESEASTIRASNQLLTLHRKSATKLWE